MTVHTRILTAVAAAAAALLALGGCAATAAPAGSPAPANPTPSVTGNITVFAAASLTPTFTELGKRFEKAHPGAHVAFSFAGSSDLVSQLKEGAPADVFASADEQNMAKLTAAGIADGAPQDFATNVLAIAVPPGNPAHLRSFADLARPGVKTVICAPQVPCGAATARIETSSGVTLHAVSEESSVTDVLGKVASGEADAGVVYVTDVKAAGAKVGRVPFPEASGTVNTYPIVAVKGAADRAAAAAFIRFVTGPAGRSVLKAAGFGAP
ncbi:MAG TPA: molybdate ABC transporter substrate-binding protein [Leifsonia sp.]